MRSAALFVLAVAAAVIPSSARADAPNRISVQGVLRNEAGILQDGTFSFVVKLFPSAASDTPLVEETVENVSVTSGVFTLSVGAAHNDLAERLASASEPHLELSVSGTVFPRQPLTSTAYALHARNASNLEGMDRTALGATYVDAAGDTMSGPLTLNADLYLHGQLALQGYDEWLRLNQSSHFTSGVHTPSNLNAQGITVGAMYYHPGAGNLHVQNSIVTGLHVSDCPSGWTCNGYFWDISAASMYASGFYNRSDARLKKNIQSVSTGLSVLSKLRPVTFEWKDARTPGVTYGFIAQEVEQVLPELVTQTQEGMKLVNTQAILPLVVQAVRELKQQNDELRQAVGRLSALEGLIRAQQERLDALCSASPRPAGCSGARATAAPAGPTGAAP